MDIQKARRKFNTGSFLSEDDLGALIESVTQGINFLEMWEDWNPREKYQRVRHHLLCIQSAQRATVQETKMTTGTTFPTAAEMRRQVDNLTSKVWTAALRAAEEGITRAAANGEGTVTLAINLPDPVIRGLKAKGYTVSQGHDQRDGPWATITW